MPIINITQADLQRTKNLPSGWYGLKVVKIHPPARAAKGDSINYKVTVFVEGAEADGKEIDMIFNSKMIGKLGPFINAVNYPAKVNAGNIELDDLQGKQCDGFINQRVSEGNMYDEVQQFMPYGMSKDANRVPF